MTEHVFTTELEWQGNTGHGTASYAGYDRTFRAIVAGKPALVGTAAPAFRGDPTRHDPEDLLVIALASCHMLSYLAHCARAGVRVLAYRDAARGRMVAHDGGGRFEEVVLQPHATIAEGDDLALAHALHERAHATCFIAASCSFAIRVDPVVRHGAPPPAPPPRRDLAVRLADRPGALAELAEAIAAAGASIEGGGAWAVDGTGAVHFLIRDADRVAAILRERGFAIAGVREVAEVRLDQDTPGQLGKLARAMAEAGVNLTAVYSDHDHQLVACADDSAGAAAVAAAWRR